jgi:hypothetical protein
VSRRGRRSLALGQGVTVRWALRCPFARLSSSAFKGSIMAASRTIRRLAAVTGVLAASTALSAVSATASESIVGIGNAAYNNTMINAHKHVTAVAHTTHGSGLLSNLSQLPLHLPRNGGAGGELPVGGPPAQADPAPAPMPQ